MQIGFIYLLFVFATNVLLCFNFKVMPDLWGDWRGFFRSSNFASLISWLNLIAGGIFIVGFLTVRIYNLN